MGFIGDHQGGIMRTRTATILLEGLHDPANDDIWREFDARFRPVIVGFARSLGLSPADAADIAQETLTRFVGAYRKGRYDRSRGRLSSWLIGIARNCIRDLYRKRGADEGGNLSTIPDQHDPHRLTLIWEQQCQRHLLETAIAVLREETRTEERTLQAFEMIIFHSRAPQEVAQELDMTPNSVYIAKNRCLTRLRSIIRDLSESAELPDDPPHYD